MAKKIVVYHILFILLLTSICHLLFSPYGFNPSDEGFVLSATNRVMHGQIPHVDFSSVRPLGYAYLHIPELLLSKKYFFLASRFIFWLEQVLIAFLWILFIQKQVKQNISLPNFYILTLMAFIFNVHYFPCSVLHTIDGLLCCLIGLNIIISEKKISFSGFFFIGFAALCKQNYLIILPVTLLLFGRKKLILNVLTGLLPVILYVSIISLFGGWNDLTTQLSGHNELWQVGFKKYLFNCFFLAGILTAFLAKKIKLSPAIYLTGISGILIGLLVSDHYHGSISFIIVGVLVTELLIRSGETDFNKILLTGLALTWCVSISVGYNTPALFSGGCLTLIIIKLNYNRVHRVNKGNYILIVILLALFYFVRTSNIYRDLSATLLTYKLDGIVEGANGIKTNQTTYSVLAELDSIKRSTGNTIPVPDFTACNILHSHQSRILTEWPNKTEIPNQKIADKVTSKIKSDSTLIFAIPKYQTALLKDGLIKLSNEGLDYPIIRYVKGRYKKYAETNFFELYK